MVLIELLGKNGKKQVLKQAKTRKKKAPAKKNKQKPYPKAKQRTSKMAVTRAIRGSNSLHRDWAAVMNDPFNFPPVKLGLGCMVPSALYTFYYRGNLTVNADGSFSVIIIPRWETSTTGSVLTNVSGAGGVTYTFNNWANLANFQTGFGPGARTRVIGGGIRVMPSIPATAAPGELYCGNLPDTTLTNALMAPGSLAGNQYSHLGVATDGATVTTRPLDLDSFVFSIDNTATTNSITRWSVPYVAGLGLPVSTVVFYETVLHVEVIGDQSGTMTPSASDSVPNREELATQYGSSEGLFACAENYLDSAVKVTSRFTNFVQGAATLGHSIGGIAGLAGTYLQQRSRQGYNRMIRS